MTKKQQKIYDEIIKKINWFKYNTFIINEDFDNYEQKIIDLIDDLITTYEKKI